MLDGMVWTLEHSMGWESIVMYQRWTGTWAVARYSYKTHRFVGEIIACAGGRSITSLEHAKQWFDRKVSLARSVTRAS